MRDIRWGRVIAGAVMLELVLFIVLVPLGELLGSPFAINEASRSSDPTMYFAAVLVGCFVFSYVVGRWAARTLLTRFALHGALIGVGATVLYLGLASIPPNSIATVAAVYGPVLFVLANGLRIAGCVAGAYHQGSKRAAAPSGGARAVRT